MCRDVAACHETVCVLFVVQIVAYFISVVSCFFTHFVYVPWMVGLSGWSMFLLWMQWEQEETKTDTMEGYWLTQHLCGLSQKQCNKTYTVIYLDLNIFISPRHWKIMTIWHFCHPQFFFFLKMITPTFQTCAGQEPNRKGDLRPHDGEDSLFEGKWIKVVCVPLKIKQQQQCTECSVELCASPCLKLILHQVAFLKTGTTLEEQSTQM